MTEHLCETCGHFGQNGFDCAQWGDFGDQKMTPCNSWFEGLTNENLRFRIQKIEERLGIGVIKTEPAFIPDWISPPGDTIRDMLEEKGISQREFGCKMRMREKNVEVLLSGEIEIDEETAIKLSDVLGSPVHFWLNREKEYRDALEEHGD